MNSVNRETYAAPKKVDNSEAEAYEKNKARGRNVTGDWTYTSPYQNQNQPQTFKETEEKITLPDPLWTAKSRAAAKKAADSERKGFSLSASASNTTSPRQGVSPIPSEMSDGDVELEGKPDPLSTAKVRAAQKKSLVEKKFNPISGEIIDVHPEIPDPRGPAKQAYESRHTKRDNYNIINGTEN